MWIQGLCYDIPGIYPVVSQILQIGKQSQEGCFMFPFLGKLGTYPLEFTKNVCPLNLLSLDFTRKPSLVNLIWVQICIYQFVCKGSFLNIYLTTFKNVGVTELHVRRGWGGVVGWSWLAQIGHHILGRVPKIGENQIGVGRLVKNGIKKLKVICRWPLQWCQLESLQVLFYEVKVPSSDGYSTI